MSVRDMLMAAAGVDTGGGSDTNFKNVTLLLNGDGTNGAQNNTFVDSSSNNFTITRNGNTTQGSFSPYGSLWSNFFQTSNSVANNPSVDFSPTTVTLSGDFTLECWISPLTYATGSSTYNDYPTVFHVQNSSNQGVLLGQFGQYGTGTASTFTFMVRDSGEKYFATATIPLGQWTHIAMVRSGSTITAYVNGTSVGSRASTETWTLARCGIGAYTGGLRGYYGFNGNISNFRLTTTAVYTTAFTPSTTPLTAITNTQLLTCQSNRFIDTSSNNFTPTIYGSPSPSVQRFSPFNPTASYDTATIGGSGYFDGSGDYLTISNNSAFQIGSGDFTLQAWVYMKQTPDAGGYVFPILTKGVSGTDYSYGFSIRGTQRLSFQYAESAGGGIATKNSSTSSIPAFTWNHVLFSRSGNTIYFFLNGVLINSESFVSFTAYSGGNLRIGDTTTDGYLCDVRINKGTSVTSDFTPPTSPLTASGAAVLCNFTNAGIPDYAMMNDLETVGNAQVSTSVKKFGTGSIAFDGNGDKLVAKTPVYMGTGNFTIEFWYYPTSFNNYQDFLIDSVLTDGSQQPKSFKFGNNSSGVYLYYNDAVGSFQFTTSNPFTLNTWQHVAFVKQGTTIYFYLNGVSTGTPKTVNQSFNYSGLQISNDGLASLNGYIDDFRLTSGVARYPNGTTFTPPTSALPVK